MSAGRAAAPIEAALRLWSGLEGARPVLINHSENHTFRIDISGRPEFVLRVHRAGYQSAGAIASELAWLEAIRRDTEIAVPRPIAGRDGECVQDILLPEGSRLAVLFAFEPGREPRPGDDLDGLFSQLGARAAMLHDHAAQWRRPAFFERPHWTARTMLDPDGLWGDWRKGPGVTGGVGAQLRHLASVLRDELAAFGTGPDRFGLIHADMRLANVLVGDGRLTIIDFDDCGFGWHLYDCAAALSFLPAGPGLDALRDAWVAGYRTIRPLPPEHAAMLPAMILLRRMVLLAWLGSHAETPLAQAHAAGFAAKTVRLAAPLLATA